MVRALSYVGGAAWAEYDQLRHAAAVIGTVLYSCFRPQAWTRAIRRLVAQQVFLVGVEPLGFVCGVAMLVGISVVVQLTYWTGKTGQSQMLGPLLVTVVAGELGPALTNIIVIVRSSSAMATELGVQKIGGEVAQLETSGSDPFLFLVLPRVIGVAIATFCLTFVFILVALASGYFFAAWLGKGSRDWYLFTTTVVNALHPHDVATILAKSILPGLFTSASCCIGGLGVGPSLRDLPRVTQRALTRSIAGLFVISAVVSLLTYL